MTREEIENNSLTEINMDEIKSLNYKGHNIKYGPFYADPIRNSFGIESVHCQFSEFNIICTLPIIIDSLHVLTIQLGVERHLFIKSKNGPVIAPLNTISQYYSYVRDEKGEYIHKDFAPCGLDNFIINYVESYLLDNNKEQRGCKNHD